MPLSASGEIENVPPVSSLHFCRRSREPSNTSSVGWLSDRKRYTSPSLSLHFRSSECVLSIHTKIKALSGARKVCYGCNGIFAFNHFVWDVSPPPLSREKFFWMTIYLKVAWVHNLTSLTWKCLLQFGTCIFAHFLFTIFIFANSFSAPASKHWQWKYPETDCDVKFYFPILIKFLLIQSIHLFFIFLL